jgi:hypothetical protein
MNTQTFLPYTNFNKVTKTVELTGFTGSFEQIKMITDMTAGLVIFDSTQAGLGGSLAGNILTFTFNTNISGIANTDKLEVIIDALSNPTLTEQQSQTTKLTSIDTDLGAITDVETVSGNGSLISILKRVRTLLSGTLTTVITAGSAVIGKVTLSAGGNDATVTTSNALKVDNSAVTQPVSGSIGVNNFPATQAVSGTVSVTDLGFAKDSNFVDSAIVTGAISTQNLVPAGSATANSAVELTITNSAPTVIVRVSGTYTGALSLQGTIDNINWVTISVSNAIYIATTGAYSASIGSASIGSFFADSFGFKRIRITALAVVTGTANLELLASNKQYQVGINRPLPVGANTIGAISNLSSAITPADAITPANSAISNAIQYGFNGTTWDRIRTNQTSAVVASSAITTTTLGATQVNYNAVGLFVGVNISAVTGTTPTYDFKLQMQDSTSTNWIDIPGASLTQKTTTGQFYLVIYPGLVAVANQSINFILPRNIRIVETIGGTTPSFTRSVNFCYQL